MSRNEYVELDSFESLGKEADSWSPLAKSDVSKSFSAQAIGVEARDRDNHQVSGPDVSPLISDPSSTTAKKTGSKLLALRHFALFHLPAIAGTLVLLSLYIAKIRWHNPPADALNAIQFTAKAHEALILISLGDILLHRIFHGLLHKDGGTPIGFLPSPFSLGAPLQYLVSSQLWTPIIRSNNNSRSHRITGIMIIFIALLSIGASPLSAVAMIPRQRWWDNPGVDIGRGVHVMQLNNSLYTSNLASFKPSELFDEEWSPTFWTRPSQEAFLQGLGLITMSNSGRSVNFPWTNITYNNYWTDYQYRPISLRSSGKAAITTCSMSAVAQFMGVIWRVWDDPSEEWLISAEHEPVDPTRRKKGKQPLVSVECSQSFLKDGVATFEFGSIDEKNKTISLDTKKYPILKDEVKNVTNSTTLLGYHFLNLRNSLKLPISTDILFVNSFNDTRLNDEKKAPEVGLNLCFITATWTEADNWIEFSKSNDVRSHLTFENDNALPTIRDTYDTDDFIVLEPEWMRNIASLPNRLSNKTSYEQMADYCASNGGFVELCLQKTLSLHVTDAISQMGAYVWKDEEDEKHLEPDLDVIRLGMYIKTYGYDFYGSRGIALAFAVLLLHVIIVLIHLVQILVSKHPWQGSSWDTFGDMLVLALGSRAPDETENFNEKPTKSKIWTKTLTVSGGGNEGRSQMLLRDDKGY
ncbi:hypothetical protein F53441_9648 [Fusarium austroafricanum]|uniref:Uncharacterized protein n=1 Tax=Fusarium austroafricanum TaxID=2364996 RepID=A0A8H4NT29_9HYPO|nr:hypothetical protein F53441_9648 [Fusarium austroafricanum]